MNVLSDQERAQKRYAAEEYVEKGLPYVLVFTPITVLSLLDGLDAKDAEIARLTEEGRQRALKGVFSFGESQAQSEEMARLLGKVDALTTEVAEYEERMNGRVLREWLPFETAPKDRTEIIVYRPDAGVFTALYTPALDEYGEEDEDYYCWFTAAGRDLPEDDLPTHWMPFPEEPEQTYEPVAEDA